MSLSGIVLVFFTEARMMAVFWIFGENSGDDLVMF